MTDLTVQNSTTIVEVIENNPIISVSESNPTITVSSTTNAILVEDQPAASIVLSASGPQGPQGPAGEPGLDGDAHQTYVFNQNTPSATWTIEHNLTAYPSVTVIDSAGTYVIGNIEYISNNVLRLTFSAAFAGQALLN
jgi:cytoskeletal protein RodZ